MRPEERSKIQSLIGDLEGLKVRNPEYSKFKDWKEKVEKVLEEPSGRALDQLERFRTASFFDFSRQGRPKEAPLSEEERRGFIQGLDEAKRLLHRFI